MSDIDSKDAAAALAAHLSGLGEEKWELKPASGSASFILELKAETPKAVGLIVREARVAADVPALTAAAVSVAAKHPKTTGVLTVRFKDAASASDAKKFAADLEAVLGLMEKAKPDPAGGSRLNAVPDGCGLAFAHLVPGAEPLAVHAVRRVDATEALATTGATEHGLLLVLPDGSAPALRLIDVSVPPGDSIPRRWWARRGKSGWNFAPF